MRSDQDKFGVLEELRSRKKLPAYAFQFAFKNLGTFRTEFLLLTLCSVVGRLCTFLTIYLLGEVISNIQSISIKQIYSFYLPAFLGSMILGETLDFFLRRYGEAFPTIYADHLNLRFYRTLSQFGSHRLTNFSKERLASLVGRYVAAVEGFLSQWFWGISRRIVEIIFVCLVLYTQDPRILLAALVYMAIFLGLALQISARFSPVAANLSRESLDSATVMGSFVQNLNVVQKLGIERFFLDTSLRAFGFKWQALRDVRLFHAKRWLAQLILFNLLYVSTLFFGIYQVKLGTLELGFLILIRYAFDRLWDIMVFILEYYVQLVQQRTDAELTNAALSELILREDTRKRFDSEHWSKIELRDVVATFPSKLPEGTVTVRVPRLDISRGEKIGIVGPSGEGKTTVLHILLNLVPFSGSYLVDGHSRSALRADPSTVSIITSNDPLFKLTVRENILLGRVVDSGKLEEVLKGCAIAQFLGDLDRVVGSADFNLSAGQEQRIRLARGLLQQSGIYLLDEALNSIDRETKFGIIEYLRTALKESTAVLVTHNEEELALVDKVYEFRSGTLLERGN